MTALRQQKQFESTSTLSSTVTLDSTPIAGNLLVAVYTATSNVATPVHPWSGTPDVALGTTTSFLWISSKIAGSSESATVTFSNTLSRGMTMTVYEVAPTTGRTWVAGVDKTITNTSTLSSNLAIGPTAAQSDAENFAVAGVSLLSSAGAIGVFDSGYTGSPTQTTAARGWAAYKILSTTDPTSSTATWSTARANVGAIATYKQTGTAIPPTHAAFLSLLKN